MGSASDDDVVELRVGEEHSLQLVGLGTAGYRWVAEIDGDAEVVEVRSTDRETVEGSGAVGASADETFAIRANQAGDATVRFVQRRPWESGDVPAASERSIRFRVT